MNNQKETNRFKFLEGGGEMGRQILAFDWSHSPLGPIEAWPQSLKTSVSLMLNSQHPMWIGWGPCATFLYNDAYIQVLSLAKHPWALGRPAAEVWAEIWHVCGPLADKVFQKAEPSFVSDVRLFMNRGDFLEETFYSFSYSPIRDESGNVGGLFCPSAEVTSKVLNTRRLGTLSELAIESLLEKSTSGACASAMGILGKNRDDIPFTLLYLGDPVGEFVGLEQAIAVTSGTPPVSPMKVELIGPETEPRLWPIREVVSTGQSQVVSVRGIVGLPPGAADQPVSEALVMPLISRGQERPLGVLIAGINPTRRLDDEYRSFFEMIAGHVTRAIQNARAAEEEKRRADMLEELDRAKTTFFSNVSHELRTPLTLILGPLEDEMNNQPASRERLEVVHRNGLRLLKLVNTLLDFSRLEAGRLEASFEPTDIAACTAELASVFRAGIERAGLRLVVDCPPLPGSVYIDRDMWEKIVFNLLSNAFKFTFQGEIKVTVQEVSNLNGALNGTPKLNGASGAPTMPAAGAVQLSVSDTGTGIPAAELPRIFDRFHRVRNARSRSHEGTGIGLALVQELSRQHGGGVSVQSEEGRGTTFTVWIPLGKEHLPKERIGAARELASTNTGALPFVEESLRWLPAHPETHRPVPPADGHRGAAKGRILVADDNADMRDYLHRLLAKDYEVITVENGRAALDAVRTERPSLVLSDVMMPLLDGFGLLQELRNDPTTRTTPIILISARAGEEARIEGTEAGADDYLTKPFSARELLACVNTHLELSRLRREAEEAIRQREERLRAALIARERSEERTLATLESITDGVHVVDAAGRITYFNTSARRIIAEHGQNAESLMGRDFFEVFPDTLSVEVGRAMRRTMQERIPTEAESFYEPWQSWFSVRHYPTADGGVSTFFQDITARKKAEAMVRQNEGLFSALVDQAPNGVYVVDAQFCLQQINARALPAFEKVYPRIGRDFSEVMTILWGAELSVEIVKIFRHTLATGERYISPRFSEFRQDLGEERSYEWETQRVTLPDGQYGVVCYFDDITARTRSEQALLEAKAAAESANRSKDRFLAALSHELRTPLTPVLMTAATLHGDKRLPADVRAQLGMMEQNIALEARLIDDLLDLSAISSGKLKIHTQPCDAHALIQLAVEIVRDAAQTKGVAVECDFTAQHYGLLVDSTRFQQVIWNLLRNAVKFTPRGGRVTIRTADGMLENLRPCLRVEVVDTGIGIKPDSLEKIFLPFEQAGATGDHRFGGLGLGLTIARTIVELHDGKIHAHSPGENQGATFVVELPGVLTTGNGGAPFDYPALPEAESAKLEAAGTVRNLLLVEDHAPTLQVLSTILTRSGYQVVAVAGVNDALAAAAAAPFDLVVSDLGLPDGTGVQLMQQLRRDHGLRGIALTGYGMEEDIEQARAAGFVAHLVKPIQISELRRILAALK